MKDPLFSSVSKSLGFFMLLVAVVLFLLPPPLQADVEEGVAAYARHDYEEALAAFRSAAGQGNAEAQFHLGILYANGLGVTLDLPQALLWYRKAAEQGHAWAQYNAGSMYYLGAGVPQDYAQADAWFRQAAEQGHAWAQYDLGSMHEFGHGVVPDTVVAYALYNLAAANEQMAKKTRDRLAQTLSRDQLAEAQRLSSSWVLGTPLPTRSKTGTR